MRVIYLLTLLLCGGCAGNAIYDPLRASSHQVILLNEGALKKIHEGMTLGQVHQVMGQEMTVGYTYQTWAYKPLTIPNPYKNELISTPKGDYMVEYYVTAVHQPDGVVSPDELMPLVFKNEILIGRGWSFVNSLRSSQPSA